MTILAALLALGATVRLTRLVTADVLTMPIRTYAADRWGEASRIAYLLSCPWCASMYVAPPVMATAHVWGGTVVWQVAAGALTASYLTGLAAEWLEAE
ncbi:hypothetical protein [Nonomuraea salmonea]|uniref:DUF1360 domain-containing protein n=1 Tax=Nonomuraea salmonea TaxID=46181 RepID=A0ABV5P2X5_9ACTN